MNGPAATVTLEAAFSREDRFAAGLLDPDIAIPDFVGGRGPGVADRRYAVYRNNVVVGLIDALKAAFPSLHAIMGEDAFFRVGRNFILAHPPRTAMMQQFGDGFAEFLAGFPPLRKSPFLADVARLERAWLDAYHAADREALSGEDLAGLGPEAMTQLVFASHPAAAVIRSDHPVVDLFGWRYRKPERAPDLDRGQCALVTRPEYEVQIAVLTPQQAWLVEQLLAGTALGEAADAVLVRDPDFDLGAALALCLQGGAFARPERKPEQPTIEDHRS